MGTRPTLLLTGHLQRERVAETLNRLSAAWASEASLRVHDLDREPLCDAESADRIVAAGGDGTILYVVRSLGEKQVPVVGVNVGKLGFLAELDPESMAARSAADVLALPVRERLMLRCRVHAEGPPGPVRYAVNDAVLAHADVGRMVRVRAFSNEHEVSTYAGDGVIVATPVGSTAYSLSAGGPVAFPTLEAMILTPICAHGGGARPLVLPADRKLTLEVVEGPAVLALDGQETVPLPHGARVELDRSQAGFLQVIYPGRSFFRILQEKLYLRGGPNYGA